MAITADKQVGGRLACGVRAVGCNGTEFAEGSRITQAAVNFIRGNLDETLYLMFSAQFEQVERADNIGVYELR